MRPVSLGIRKWCSRSGAWFAVWGWHFSANLALCFALAWTVPLRAIAQPMTVTVVVNGRTLPETAVEVSGDSVYVALRPLGQALEADVTANVKAQSVTITTLLRQVVLHVDSTSALVNGQRVALSAAPRKSGGRIVLPLRAVGEAFGATVVYDPRTHAAIVSAATRSTPAGGPTPPALASAKTFSGSVASINVAANPPAVLVNSNGTSYTVTVPAGTSIEFRDVHGAVTGIGVLSQVRPGDALVLTLDSRGQLISMADLFASINGTIAAVADQSMVLDSGRVISGDSNVTITLDGKDATFASLRPGDKVSVRADPVSGNVRDVVALRPGGYASTAVSTPVPGVSGSTAAVQITSVRDNATAAFRAGQLLVLSAEGTPAARATFDLSDVIIGTPMRETRPGHYEGQYQVMVGTNLVDAPILVRLSRNGETAVAEAPEPLNVVTTPPSVKEVGPLPGSRINTSRPSIFATFLTIGNKGMEPSSLRMTLNGHDVTPQTTRDPTYISYYPASDLEPQTVEVEVKGTDIAGNTLDYTWTFWIVGR